MAIEYANMPYGMSKWKFALRYLFNKVRTWYYFHVRFPWVKYDGFVRVLKGTTFVRRDIHLGHNVQFGRYCDVAADVEIGSYVLFGNFCRIVGKYDHTFKEPRQLIWESVRKRENKASIGSDVWIGNGSIIVGGVQIGNGAIVAAGSVVTKDIPPFEVWGGNPAHKIHDRFNEEEKLQHMKRLKELGLC